MYKIITLNVVVVQGCSSPMVVKFADTQKEKDQKRVHHVGSTNLWGGIGLNNLPPQYLTVIILFFSNLNHPPKLIQIFNFFF